MSDIEIVGDFVALAKLLGFQKQPGYPEMILHWPRDIDQKNTLRGEIGILNNGRIGVRFAHSPLPLINWCVKQEFLRTQQKQLIEYIIKHYQKGEEYVEAQREANGVYDHAGLHTRRN